MDAVNTSRTEVGDRPTVPLRHPGRWIATAVIALLLVLFVITLFTNDRFEWPVVWQYFLSPPIISGLWITLGLTVVAMLIGFILGTILALMRLSPNKVLSSTSWAFIWLFRGTPLLVQLIFWYNLSSLFPHLSLGIPFGPQFVTIDTNSLISAATAAILGLGLNEGAYMAEIIRAGILSVDEGQFEVSSALGMSRATTMRFVILPQAMRTILPPTGNEVINMLKSTSLVSVVAVADLLFASQLIYSRTFQTIPLLIMASIWYILLTSILSVGQHYLEKRFTRGSSRTQQKTLAERWGAFSLRRDRQPPNDRAGIEDTHQ
jgi:polar amino acid transport system permease protein